MIRRPRTALRTALRGERGSVEIETVIMLPVLVLFYLTSFTFFDAYRTQSAVARAGYVVSDALSRRSTVATTDIDGLRDLFGLMARARGPVRMRVTEVMRPTGADVMDYVVTWSHGSEGFAPMTAADLDDLLDPADEAPVPLPTLIENERITLVQTRLWYEPPFYVGLGGYWMGNLVVTRQRSDPRLCLEGQPCL